MESYKNIKKIAVVGPESTGKSVLSAELAQHYNTVWVPEYSREYCSKLTEPCSWQDEINMFKGQIELENQLLPQANDIIICDTTFITVKIWSEYMFGKAPEEVLSELSSRKYDFYLLMDIDLPWEEDPLRDFPHLRDHFMQIWHQELQMLHANYTVVSGLASLRTENAIIAINNFLTHFAAIS